MKAAIVLGCIGALLSLCGWALIRSDALYPGGRGLLGYALAGVGLVFILIAAAGAVHSS